MTQKLILLRGCSGSGKTSLAEFLLGSIAVRTCYFEADMYFETAEGYKFDPAELGKAHEWCQIRTKSALTRGLNVVVSNTSTTEKEVAVYQQIAQECGVEFISLVVERRHDGVNHHGVPDDKLHQQAQRLRNSLKL